MTGSARLTEPGSTIGELAGFTIGVTADRRRDELAALLERHDARVVMAPALRIVPLTDDNVLRSATRACLSNPPDVLVASTGIGLRGWLQTAERWGLAGRLRSILSRAYLIARGPRAHDAVREAGLPDAWTPATDDCAEIVDHLRDLGMSGRVIAVQLSGPGRAECSAALAAAGATVIEVPVHRWAPPADPAPLHRLVDLIDNRLVEAVAFTSAPATVALLDAAGPRTEALLDALRSDVLAACVGPVTAAPLRRHGVPVLTPARARRAALVRLIVDELPPRAIELTSGGHTFALRGHAAVVDGELRPLAPAPMTVLRTLARAPDRVLSRATLLRALPRGADEHAVEMAVARLRAGLRTPGVVQTVARRGYRLQLD